MGFKRIPKEEWDNMTYQEQNYWRLEFDKSIAKRLKSTIIITRILALLLIGVLFFIGFAQLKAVNDYNQIKDKYGSQAYCYLCGLENYKKCECQYFSDYNDKILEDLESYSLQLAEYNIKNCGGLKVQDGTYDYGGINIDVNSSLLP
jgi:hypothetical protein